MRAVLTTAIMLLVACNSGPPEPRDPVWGKQACEQCLMLINERPPAAQALRTDGSRKFFDDVGCLVEWLDRDTPAPKAVWVRAPQGEGWVDAYAVRYRSGNRTPMDYGFLPSEEGVSFDELRALVRKRRAERQGGEL